MSTPLDLTPPTGERLAHIRAATDWVCNVPRDGSGKALVTLAAWLGHDDTSWVPDPTTSLGRLWANHGVHLDAAD